MEVLPAQTVTVDLKDLKILAGGLKGYSTVFKLYTAYSIEGQKKITEEVTRLEQTYGRDLTDREMHSLLKKYPDYLTLENDHRMGEIVSDLENIVETGMDLEALNNQFCESELRNNNLVKNICFGKDARESMQTALDHLSGPQEVVLGLDKAGREIRILMDLPGYLARPVRDLKSLMPSEYHQDGSSNHTQAPNLNGLFPNNDLYEKLKQVVSE